MLKKIVFHSLALFFILYVTMVSIVDVVCADFLPPIWVLNDPTNDGGGTPSLDVLSLYYTNDGTQFRFIVNLAADASGTGQGYVIYLDTISGQGATKGPEKPLLDNYPKNHYMAGADYCVVYSTGYTGIWVWDGTSWGTGPVYSISVDISVSKTLILTGYLADIGYPYSPKYDMKVAVYTFAADAKKDDTSIGTILYENIPEFPWPTLPIFIVTVTATIFIIYKKRFNDISKFGKQLNSWMKGAILILLFST